MSRCSDFVYFSWCKPREPHIQVANDPNQTVRVTSSNGPYKHVYGKIVLRGGQSSSWAVKILRGNYFKIGVIKGTDIEAIKASFTEGTNGFGFYSQGFLRHASNTQNQGISKAFLSPVGPGDVVRVRFDGVDGSLSFAINQGDFQQAFASEDFTRGGFMPVVGALLKGSQFCLDFPQTNQPEKALPG